MADLSSTQATLSTTVVGSDTTGNETTPLNVSLQGEATVVDGLSGPGLFANLSVPTANTPVEVKVGVSRLAGRKSVTVQPVDGDFYWGFSSSVTTANGTLIRQGSFTQFSLNPLASTPTQIWLVSPTSGDNARITESL